MTLATAPPATNPGSWSGSKLGRRGRGSSSFIAIAVQAVVIAALSALTLLLIWMYANSLRDARYLDGWILGGGMVLQLMFHIAAKTGRSPKAMTRWRVLHIFCGFLLIAAFVSHSNTSLPDSVFEWALWSGFVMVTLTGIIATYLARLVQARRTGDPIAFDRIPARRAELARDVHAAVMAQGAPAPAVGLPAPPYDAWIFDLYVNHLRSFFAGPRDFISHLVNSQTPLKQLTDEIDDMSRYVDAQGQEKLAVIRELVVEKSRVDFQHAYSALTRVLMFVHVPITYAVIVLTVMHVVVVYAFSSSGG